jgi:hypothetical protein
MKIVIGIIVVLGLGWLLLGAGGEEAAAPEAPAVEEVMEEGEAMMEEGEGNSDGTMMEEGEGHSDDAMMEEGEAMMEEGEAMMEEETPVAE